MEEKSFDMLLDSINEMELHMKGKTELKKTPVENIEVSEVSPINDGDKKEL